MKVYCEECKHKWHPIAAESCMYCLKSPKERTNWEKRKLEVVDSYKVCCWVNKDGKCKMYEDNNRNMIGWFKFRMKWGW